MVGKSSSADLVRETHIRFRNMECFESYINAIDQDYESEDAIFNAYIQKIDILQFNLDNRSQYGNGCVLKNNILLKTDVIFVIYQQKDIVC